MKESEKLSICPFIRKPDKDCYCVNINSSKVISVLDYCGGAFKKCHIYKRLMEKGKSAESTCPPSGEEKEADDLKGVGVKLDFANPIRYFSEI